MKILLIQPPYERVVIDTTSIPLGLASIATYVQNNGYDVSCLDCSVESMPITDYFIEFDIIGVQLHSYESLNLSIEYIRNIKSVSGAIIAVGGPVATFYHEFLKEIECVDYIVTNEGEDAFLYLISSIYAQSKNIPKIIKGDVFRKNIDEFKIPNRKFFKTDEYRQWSIITSRGCPYSCKFCTVPSFWKNTFRQRTPENIIGEIEYLINSFGVTKIFILDDAFTVNRARTVQILDLIKKRRLNFEWACLTRADLIDRDLLKQMKETGCSVVSLGVESANQDTLDYLDKKIKVKTLEEAIYMVKDAKIRTRCSLIFGFPNEKKAHLINNIGFLKKTYPDEIQIYPLFPYFGTELGRQLSHVDVQKFSRGKDALRPIIGTNHLQEKDISEAVLQCVNEMQNLGYVWLSSHAVIPQKNNFEKVIMTEFAPIQALQHAPALTPKFD